MAAAERAPTGEQGAVRQSDPIGSWANFVDTHEYVPELTWPTSVRETYPRMLTDTQLAALMRGTTLDITRYAWGLDQNGSRPELFDAAQREFNLLSIDDAIIAARTGISPVPIGRSRNRFSFHKHLTEVLKAPALGHRFFEQVGDVGDDGLRWGAAQPEFWHLRKLGDLPPRTITGIKVAPDGGLEHIEQFVQLQPTELKVSRLVAYVFEPEDRGDWIGKSLMRPCFREWLIKDRLLRVDARNQEKAGGMWWAEAAKDATEAEKQELADLARDIGVMGPTGAVPAGAKLHLERPSGGATDAINSINRHDEAMARAFLMMFMQLGSTNTGSRALGDSFIDWFAGLQQAIAVWARDIFNEHMVEDWVDWNYGAGEEFVPRVAFVALPKAQATPPLSGSGATLDPALEAALQGAAPAKVAKLRAAYQRENRRYRVALARLLPSILSEEELAAVGDIVEADEEIDEALHAALDEVAVKPTRTRAAGGGAAASTAAALPLPDRQLHRQPYEHEVRAQVDFKQLDLEWQSDVDRLVAAWQTVRLGQIDELAAAVEAAAGDLEKLAAVAASPAGGEIIAERLAAAAATGAALALQEAVAQGLAGATPGELADVTSELAIRASALEQVLARSLSEAAARKALSLTGGSLTSEEVAIETRNHLAGLTDAYLNDQFGGAVTTAQNAGRRATFKANDPSRIYASELLDANTCSPCRAIDGTQYATLEEAAHDYPTGGFRDCQGGPRCRGTEVAVYDEAEATL